LAMAAMRTTYEVAPEAYLKMVMHAKKHAHEECNGLLIGTTSEGGDGHRVCVEDAVPLFHGTVGVAPMAEVALAQVAQHARKKKGMLVVGCYHANERADDDTVGPRAKWLADGVQRNAPKACLLLLDNARFHQADTGTSVPLFHCHVKEGGKWKRGNPDGNQPVEAKLVPATSPGVLAEYLKEKRHLQIVDFDDHLDDPSKDWLNPEITA